MSEFVDYLSEVFESFGAIQAKRMFGGYGVYHQGVMFALVADDELYLKADTESVGLFEKIGSKPFEYDKAGKKIRMSYFHAPENIYDDPDAARLWASRAYQAAIRTVEK